MSNGWVKNVYSLRTSSGIWSGELYPIHTTRLISLLKTNGQLVNYSLTIRRLSSTFSTIKFTVLHLLKPKLYLFSTPPTITKTIQKNLNHS